MVISWTYDMNYNRVINEKIIRGTPFQSFFQSVGNEKKIKDPAVSPVIGIMLMLIVTVILAAIISGYVGGMSETKSKPPQLVLQTELVKGDYVNVSMTVLSAGNGIPTRDLKIITSWTSGSYSGGNITVPGCKYPLGLVPSRGNPLVEDFGNYTLLGGTKMIVNNTDGIEAFFGDQYALVDAGGIVDIKIIHIPSQSTIYNQEFIIEGDY